MDIGAIEEVEKQNSGDRIQYSEWMASSAMDLKPAKTFEDLIVWQKAHEFVLAVYRFTDEFPKSEIYGLTSQLRRAAVSIAANIAEGFKKSGRSDKARFLNISQGSIEECRYYLILAKDLQYGQKSELNSLLEEVSKVLTSYRSAILNSDS
ncbi:MAG: four helix bundle protein [Ignavibacteriales bacterium]|nr:four helix bundle protein [Ignavibacteriales bacterium]